MSIQSNYYAVMIKTAPFDFGSEQQIGCYTTRNTAMEVVRFVRNAFERRVDGGIDFEIRDFEGEIIHTAAGLRLKDTPMGCITIIKEALTHQEAQHLLHVVPSMIEADLEDPISTTKPSNATGVIDPPRRILEGVYHCVVLRFEPFDHSHELFAGYYQSKATAQEIVRFIIRTHQQEKVGEGFDMDIESYQGKFVEHDSGKRYLKVDGVDQEIKMSCEVDEYLRLSKVINEAIEKWSSQF